MDDKWLVVRMSPKDYARMTGHSERFVRSFCMPERLRTDKGALIEMRVPTGELLANCYKLTATGSEERRRSDGSGYPCEQSAL